MLENSLVRSLRSSGSAICWRQPVSKIKCHRMKQSAYIEYKCYTNIIYKNEVLETHY